MKSQPEPQGPFIVENSISKETAKAYEGMLSQGSGFLHIRASFEEGLKDAPQNLEYMRLPANVTLEKPRHPRSKAGTFIPGVNGLHPLLREEGANLPNPLCLEVSCNGEHLDMDCCKIKNYSRSLELASGELRRTFIWETKGGQALECAYLRTVSMARPNLVVQKISYRCLKGPASLDFFSFIDTDVRTNGYNHFKKLETSLQEGLQKVELVTDAGMEVSILSATLSDGCPFFPAKDGGRKGLFAARQLQKGSELTIYKLTAFADRKRDLQGCLEEAIAGREKLFSESRAEWQKMWAAAKVSIEGDQEAQKALDFSVYHLLRCAPKGNPKSAHAAICAKGNVGEAYYGHYFWDTELYLMPFYQNTLPRAAKALAYFRINTLKGAKKYAASLGYHGARYPWESAPSGLEQCSNFQYADHEVHVTADVAYGLWNYYCATRDEETLKAAMPVFTETARYWLERVYREKDGSYSLKGVMGPDEYICLCDNEAYTNQMVSYVLNVTADLLERFESPKKAFIARLRKVAEKLPLRRGKNGVIMQCDHFEDFEEPDFQKIWKDRSKPFGNHISQERNYRTKALKQAAVIMLPYLFPKSFTPEETKKTFAYYLPYTTHDSSLSYAVHAIVAANIGETKMAYGFFKKALKIDTDPKTGGASEGIHMANAGGLWQAVIYGFAGMSRATEGKGLAFSPNLPKNWKSLSFRLCHKGKIREVSIKGRKAEIKSVK